MSPRPGRQRLGVEEGPAVKIEKVRLCDGQEYPDQRTIHNSKPGQTSI